MKKFSITFLLLFTVGAAHAANNCTGATYYDSDSDTCIACPTGYDYNTDAGKTDISQCQIHCDAGTWNEYNLLEYIESTGTQWIDTGILVSSLDAETVTIETTFQMLTGNDVDWFGTINTKSGATIIYDVAGAAGAWIRWGTMGGRTLTNTTRSLYIPDALHKVKLTGMNDLSIYIDDVLVATSTITGAQMVNKNPILIGRGRNISVGRWKNFKIQNGDDVVFNGVAMRRNIDGVVGMYDTVTGTFFTNAGTGEFIAGPDIGSCENVGAGYYAPAQAVNFGSVGTRTACPAGTYSNVTNASSCTPCANATYNNETAATSCKSCPNGYNYNNTPGKTDITQCQIHCDAGTWNGEYTQLEYIETSGTQWIDTGILVSSLDAETVTIETTFQMLTGNDVDWFGTIDTTSGATIIYDVAGADGAWIRWGTTGGRTLTNTTRSLYIPDALHKVKLTGMNDLSIYIDDVLVATSTITGAQMVNKNPILIGRGRNISVGRWKNFKIQNGDDVVFNGVATRRNIDGVVGMYDTVTGTFFTNAGTGEFIAGLDIGSCENVGAGYYAPASTVNYGSSAAGRTQCPAGTTTVGYGHGADSANDCGRTLHVGDNVLYMRKNKETSPALHIQMENGDMFYVNLSPTNHNMSKMHLWHNGTKYTAYDDSLFYNERDFDTNQQISQ